MLSVVPVPMLAHCSTIGADLPKFPPADVTFYCDCSIASLSSESRKGDVRSYCEEVSVEGGLSPLEIDSELWCRCTEGSGGAIRASGRALVCSCMRGEFTSITMRVSSHLLVPGASPTGTTPAPLIDPKAAWEASSEPSTEYPISVRALCDAIKALASLQEPFPSGLIAITGGTGSCKSQVARGLAWDHLRHLVGRTDRVYPHLLTIEDPIEKALVEGTGSDGPRPATPAETKQLLGIDYTPREIGPDVGSLEEALRDALRQTPAVVFIGEIRTLEDLQAALEFAGTGHLVIATFHAGSLSESIRKILDSYEATTPARCSEVMNRVCAVVHLLPRRLTNASGGKVNVVLPASWHGNPKSRAEIVADGLSSIVASGGNRGSCKGRRAYFERLNTGGALDSVKDSLVCRATELDLEGV